jgi:hypothetical protein
MLVYYGLHTLWLKLCAESEAEVGRLRRLLDETVRMRSSLLCCDLAGPLGLHTRLDFVSERLCPALPQLNGPCPSPLMPSLPVVTAFKNGMPGLASRASRCTEAL